MTRIPSAFEQFPITAGDPFEAEHGAVAQWVEDSITATEGRYYSAPGLDALRSGQRLLASTPEQSVRYLRAAIQQTRHWYQMAKQVEAQAASDFEKQNICQNPAWKEASCRKRQALLVINALMRRALPLERDDLLALIDWCNAANKLYDQYAPLALIKRALERYLARSPLDPQLRQALDQFASLLRAAPDIELKRLGRGVESLIANSAETSAAQSTPEHLQPNTPSLPGSPEVLDQLKRHLGLVSDCSVPETVTLDPHQFPLRADSPLRFEHQVLSSVLEEMRIHADWLKKCPSGQQILESEPAVRGRFLLAAAERHVHAMKCGPDDADANARSRSRRTAERLVETLLESDFSASRAGLFDLLLYLATRCISYYRVPPFQQRVIGWCEYFAASEPLSAGERFVLALFRSFRIAHSPAEETFRLSRLIADSDLFCLVPGELWSDAVNAEYFQQTPARWKKWAALLRHLQSATTSKPSAKWLKTASGLIEAVGQDRVLSALRRWLPLVLEGSSWEMLTQRSRQDPLRSIRVQPMPDENATCLRGLLWSTLAIDEGRTLARDVAAVALACYEPVPTTGPRAMKAANAAVYVLSQMGTLEAVGQLAVLKVRARSATPQNEIEKAFAAAAKSLGMLRDEIEELGVPGYGLEEIGIRRESIGDYRAELSIRGSDARLSWYAANGKPLKSVPASVKTDHADDFKELQRSLKDVRAMLPAQRDRLDSLFIQQRTWKFEAWRERYLDHPLVGTLARRLLWCVDGESVLFRDGHAEDVRGVALEIKPGAEITLWHPLGRSIEEITSWRGRLEQLGITQPFKQAHREVYLLTDAERNTRTYSNRFAAHILRQHQFHALCAVRGWRYRVRVIGTDGPFAPAHKLLPRWNLRAEFWAEPIEGDPVTGTSDTGVFVHLSTDQIRFYPTSDARRVYSGMAAELGQEDIDEPLPLEEVPPLVFSEIMRDVDLFVGVANSSNESTRQNDRPIERPRDYWYEYSFGPLQATATTRKQVLEHLIPRLKIADRCTFSERFLIVAGRKRTYKIHLGSGNILMEPNDMYLCIVPDSRARSEPAKLFLPFEGDNMLSIILSKALLLADDDKIKDPTIMRQIDPS